MRRRRRRGRPPLGRLEPQALVDHRELELLRAEAAGNRYRIRRRARLLADALRGLSSEDPRP